MQFVKQSFMGIELDVLIGHPEHRLLFIATQVARAAGLKNPSSATYEAKRSHSVTLTMGDVTYDKTIGYPVTENGRRYKDTTALFSQSQAYQMLLRGHAPASEPFRVWVTEVVLPSIVETGKFDVNEATDETSQQFAGEFAALHAEIAGLKEMLLELMARPVAVAMDSQGNVEPSPYEGQEKVTVCRQFDPKLYKELAEMA
ncbi:BRO family protein [Stutzerimonas nitrititolerans]|uniref:BRO family protein n=1 Tax=Stutzerimonas nitrititolerans TaxID=2482751 RepID=UPI0028A0FF4E|nr:BRO family protein [Stutzerimonas nitrititolerans]